MNYFIDWLIERKKQIVDLIRNEEKSVKSSLASSVPFVKNYVKSPNEKVMVGIQAQLREMKPNELDVLYYAIRCMRPQSTNIPVGSQGILIQYYIFTYLIFDL